MFLIVGLGNPGDKYKTTFHNMGFMVLEAAAQKMGGKFKTKECKAETASFFIGGEKVILARPQTYMNLSGESVRELMGKYKIQPENLLVVYDDFDIPRGSLRLRMSGSGGTHNGMKSIIANIGTCEFKRIRVGIGSPPSKEFPIADYVLSNIPEDGKEIIFSAVMRAAECIESFARGENFEKLMQKYNGAENV